MSSAAPWRVSAIIPSYNRAEFLAETISCLLAQTSPPHQIIVVDDGSIDDTAAVVAKFGTAVRYERIENSGAPVARNVGAAMATGDWLWFCDSDDLWRPSFLARMHAVAQTPPHPQFLFGNFQLIKNGQWEATTKFATAPEGFWEHIASRKTAHGTIFTEPLYAHILKFQPIFPSTIVMTKTFFESVGGFDAKFARTASEDFEFTLRCVAQAPIGMIEESLVGIRRHPGNYSANQLANLLGEVKILRHAKSHHGAAMPFAAAIDGDIERRNLEALALAFSSGKYDLVRSLAGEIGTNNLGFKPRLKALLASLPRMLRAPLVALAGRANPPAAPQGRFRP
jgi:glycosyltransferase involved in cell wall biosynthesis